MIVKLFKSKLFWTHWLILSCIGGIVSYILYQNLDDKLSNSKTAYVREFRQTRKHSSIITVERDADTLEYAKYFKTQAKRLDFSFTALPEGTKVYILEISPDGNLVKIAVKWGKNNRIYGSYGEYWIWHEFIAPPAGAGL